MFSSFKKVLPVALMLMVSGTLAACSTGQEKVAELTAKAEQGDVDAMVEVGEMYCSGTTI